jgi:hypothetical protein
MEITKQQLENLLLMLNSSDKSNQTVVFEFLNNSKYTNYFGELLVLFQFGKASITEWKEGCKDPLTFLFEGLEPYAVGDSCSNCSNSTKAILDEKVSAVSKELFFELLNAKFFKHFEDMKYPMDKLNLSIKPK